uniref:(California timema) hypothetical protein n=1 Tax=Timema californicum TaxID=61474 RepID=A0A7R9JAN9_TIMCA|nr:unnamed protein product [Timema californicum]
MTSSTKKHDTHSHHVVNITNGALRGKKVTTCNGVTYWSFEGIPYALPPVGPNRFKIFLVGGMFIVVFFPPNFLKYTKLFVVAQGPQDPQNWTDIREAVEEGSACPHFTDSLQGNEDCLFVNVYTPQVGQTNIKILSFGELKNKF